MTEIEPLRWLVFFEPQEGTYQGQIRDKFLLELPGHSFLESQQKL